MHVNVLVAFLHCPEWGETKMRKTLLDIANDGVEIPYLVRIVRKLLAIAPHDYVSSINNPFSLKNVSNSMNNQKIRGTFG